MIPAYIKHSNSQILAQDANLVTIINRNVSFHFKHSQAHFVASLFRFIESEPRTSLEIQKELKLTHKETQKILDLLSEHNLIEFFNPQKKDIYLLSAEIKKKFSILTNDSELIYVWIQKIKNQSLRIYSHTNEIMEPLHHSLDSWSFSNVKIINSIEQLTESDLVIIPLNEIPHSNKSQMNHDLLQKKCRYIALEINTMGGSIGPIMGFSSSPCLHCLDVRQNNQNTSASSQKILPTNQYSPWILDTLAPILSMEIVKFVCKSSHSQLTQGFYSYDLLKHQTEFHYSLPLPFCPECSTIND